MDSNPLLVTHRRSAKRGVARTSRSKPLDPFSPGFNEEDVKSGRTAFLQWLGIMAALTTTSFFLNVLLGEIVVAWWLLSSLAYFLFWPAREKGSLESLELSKSASISTSNSLDTSVDQREQHLKQTLKRGHDLFGVREPAVFFDAQSNVRVYILAVASRAFLCTTQGALNHLCNEELDCLVLNCLIHQRQGYARRLTALRLLDLTPKLVRRGLVWPVALYGFLLRLRWQAQAECAGDRVTLLLMGNPKLVTQALLKEFASNDAHMIEKQVTSQDVESYVQQENVIGSDGAGALIQYKIGTALRENPRFDARLRALAVWSNSKEYAAARRALVTPKAATDEMRQSPKLVS